MIALKAKEREIKIKGRFYALMSWGLREYFMFTEYLIEENINSLFDGLTMAYDQNTIVKKMLDSASGQGYDIIGHANHLDYQKWNNHQKREATEPVFPVMGQFYGLPNLFSRTHEMFEKSWVYYRDRHDLMKINSAGELENRTDVRVCWNGQARGLEGLRQKGWSVLNLLLIERESRVRNTRVKLLAQGDNQVICTNYKIRARRSIEERQTHIDEAMANNALIMDRIRFATSRIGLLINEDETCSAWKRRNYPG